MWSVFVNVLILPASCRGMRIAFVLSVWLISLSMLFSGFTRIVDRIRMAFFFKAAHFCVVCIDRILCSQSPVMDTWSISTLAILNKAAMNIAVRGSDRFLFAVLSGIYIEVGLLVNQAVSLCLAF